MASQVGNASRVGRCVSQSSKCANDNVARNGANARDSIGKGTEAGVIGLGGQYAARWCGNGVKHVCRLHVIHDVRKSVFTLRIGVFTE